MKQVYLISCVKSKQTASPSCRAEDMYISALYRASLSHALSWVENKFQQIFILSALYGLLALDENISYYEKTLGNMSAPQRAQWGRNVAQQLAAQFDLHNTHFIFLAGEHYVAPLRKYLPHYSQPMNGLAGIGNRIGWLEENMRHCGQSVPPPPTPKVTAAPGTASAQTPFAHALAQQMELARHRGAASLTITSKELHQLVGGYPGAHHKMPVCCDVMYAAMRKGDVILAAPPSGKGASVKITYALNPDGRDSSQRTTAVFVPACTLRGAEALQQVPGDKPGWYRWWAPEAVIQQLLDSPHLSKRYCKALLPHLWRRERKDSQGTYYCIYVGVAIKESIRARLNWHINQPHTETAVKSGTLSTLRQTLSSLAAGNQYDQDATDAVIDQLVVEYYALALPVKSARAKGEILEIERREMAQHILPLNIMGNAHGVLQPFLTDLKQARKTSNPHRR